MAHLVLLLTVAFCSALVLHARPHLLFLLELEEVILFVANTGLLLTDDLAGECVHEILSAGLTGFELVKTVRLLLIKHLAVFDLCKNISAYIGLTLLARVLLVGLVLVEHLL